MYEVYLSPQTATPLLRLMSWFLTGLGRNEQGFIHINCTKYLTVASLSQPDVGLLVIALRLMPFFMLLNGIPLIFCAVIIKSSPYSLIPNVS